MNINTDKNKKTEKDVSTPKDVHTVENDDDVETITSVHNGRPESSTVRRSIIGGMPIMEYLNSYGFQATAIRQLIDAELLAAIGASLSRDPSPLEKRLTGMMCEGGYGHSPVGKMSPVGEMGHLFLTVEGISMIGALFTLSFGRSQEQEVFARHLDFGKEKYLLPAQLRHVDEAHTLVRSMFALYRDVLNILMDEFVGKQKMSEAEAKLKAFDIAGAFLPCAAKTGVVITSDIRNLIEQAWALTSHLDHEEVSVIGDHILTVLEDFCPKLVKPISYKETGKSYATRMKVRGGVEERQRFYTDHNHPNTLTVDAAYFATEEWKNLVSAHIPHMHFPHIRLPEPMFRRFGIIRADFQISIHSLQDILQHRSFGRMWKPVVDTPKFSQWYIRNLPCVRRKEISARVSGLIAQAIILRKKMSVWNTLGLFPMGIPARLEMSGDISAWLYFLRLRSGVKVHPEVRNIISKLLDEISQRLGVSKLYLERASVSTGHKKDA